jgi:hypothetical protein
VLTVTGRAAISILIVLKPTHAGNALIPRLRRTFLQADRALLAGLTMPEVEQLRALRARMIENAHREDAR